MSSNGLMIESTRILIMELSNYLSSLENDDYIETIEELEEFAVDEVNNWLAMRGES